MKYRKNFYQIKSNREIFEKIKKERGGDDIGYYKLPYHDTSEIKDYVFTITKKHIILVGIGGSSLGVRAIYEFLLTSNSLKDIVFLDTVDPLKVNYSLRSVDLDDSQYVIISKSGNTIETISLFNH